VNLIRRMFLSTPDAPSGPEADQRCLSDRRNAPTSPWAALPPAGHRTACRRAEEHRRPYFVDRFSSSTFIVIMMLVAASMLDATLTVHLLEAGAKEINPLMDRLLMHGVGAFLLGKYVLTVGGLPLLLIFQNHYLFNTRLRVGHLIPIAVALYAVLIGYQFVLMQGVY
jgi:hypothetical protein